MSDTWRMLKATGNLLLALGYSAMTIEKVRNGKEGEWVRPFKGAVNTTYKNWNEFKFLYNGVKSYAEINLEHPHQQKDFRIGQGNGYYEGFYTGEWYCQEFNHKEVILHDGETNAISLYIPRISSSEFNIFIGAIDFETGVLVWTGKNSVNTELVIVGTPDYEGYNLTCHTWIKNSHTNEMNLDSVFELNKIK